MSLAKWPEFDKRKIDDKLEAEEKEIEKIVKDIRQIKEITKKDKPKVYIYTIPSETKSYFEKAEWIAKASGAISVEVYAVNDKNKQDPEGKSKKVKPGRPGIFVE